MAFHSMAEIHGGDPDNLLSGMILQVISTNTKTAAILASEKHHLGGETSKLYIIPIRSMYGYIYLHFVDFYRKCRGKHFR